MLNDEASQCCITVFYLSLIVKLLLTFILAYILPANIGNVPDVNEYI